MYEDTGEHPYFIGQRAKKVMDKKALEERNALGYIITTKLADLIEWEIRKIMEIDNVKKRTQRQLIGTTIRLFNQDIKALQNTLPDVIIDILARFQEQQPSKES